MGQVNRFQIIYRVDCHGREIEKSVSMENMFIERAEVQK